VHSVQKAGYTWAVTTEGGINTPQSNPYLLYRFGVNAPDHWLIVAVKACGIWHILRENLKALLRRQKNPPALDQSILVFRS